MKRRSDGIGGVSKRVEGDGLKDHKTIEAVGRGAAVTAAELRAQRRSGAEVVLTGSFVLTDQLTELLAPLGTRTAALPATKVIRAAVEDVAASVDALVAVSAKVLAESDARRRTSGLPLEQAGNARTALLQLHRRPVLAEISAGAVETGTWAQTCIEHGEPFSGPLSALLARAKPPGHTGPALSVSERVMAPLSELDVAVDHLDRVLRSATGEPDPTGPSDLVALTRERTEAQARQTLLGLGIDPDEVVSA